jgi:hypothetical protein
MRAAVVAAALGIAAAVWAQPATGTVKGTVRRPAGPVASVRVEIDSAADSKYSASTTTDSSGAFTMSGVPVGGVGVKVYNDKSEVIAQRRGTIEHAGDTLTLVLPVP